MTPSEFCYWLQGYFELGGRGLTEAQVKAVKEHLESVFTKFPVPQPDFKKGFHQTDLDVLISRQVTFC